jgi:hypothetical protein
MIVPFKNYVLFLDIHNKELRFILQYSSSLFLIHPFRVLCVCVSIFARNFYISEFQFKCDKNASANVDRRGTKPTCTWMSVWNCKTCTNLNFILWPNCMIRSFCVATITTTKQQKVFLLLLFISRIALRCCVFESGIKWDEREKSTLPVM